MNSRIARPQAAIIPPENAVMIKPFGLDMKVLLTTEATWGAISVVMAWHKPGEGPPNHIHFGQEEMFFTIDGTYEVTIGDETSAIGPGTMVFIPRNTVHRFKNIGLTTACMLDWSLPGGQDHYFKAISELATGGEFAGERAIEVSREFDTNFPAAHQRAGARAAGSLHRAINQ